MIDAIARRYSISPFDPYLRDIWNYPDRMGLLLATLEEIPTEQQRFIEFFTQGFMQFLFDMLDRVACFIRSAHTKKPAKSMFRKRLEFTKKKKQKEPQKMQVPDGKGGWKIVYMGEPK